MEQVTDQSLLTAQEAALAVRLSVRAFWRAVAARRLPAPVYPMSKAPRWFASELREALVATRALPSQQKIARQAARLNLAA